MATMITTVDILPDEYSLAEQAANALGFEIDWHEGTARISTTEGISIARMLGYFWTEFADIAEGVHGRR